jgi:type IV pilus assembly protein PilB
VAKKIFLGEMLVNAGLISKEQLVNALEFQKSSGLRLGKTLINMGIVTEEAIIEAIGEQAGIPYVNLDSYVIDQKVLDIIPENIARSQQIFPLFKIGDTLTVAMADPLNVRAIDEVIRKAGCEVETVVSTEKQILNAIQHYYGLLGSFDDIVKTMETKDKKVSFKHGGAEEEAPVIRLVNHIILQAVRDYASDIHIEPDDKNIRIRYRIDGILHETIETQKHLQAALISRIKVMANMDIAETRSPQDGRIQMNLDGKEIELRVSSFPTIYGENIVMRILDQSKTVLLLEELGFPKSTLEKYRKLLTSPYGIILVTGPTGSGKTTTLYASLNAVNSINKNIITVEDPVEYRLKFIRQTQVNPKAGVTFASSMRAILRQDPDIIMVGEMRDLETSETAYQSALTGHLVFSTLHTNDAASALARLLHLGIEPFLISSSTNGVIAQRLVRTICPNCKTRYKPSEEELRSYNIENNYNAEFCKGSGCKQCRQSGYKGRTGIYELMVMDDNLRKLIMENASVSTIRQAAKQTQGMKTLRERGLSKAIKGITTLEEVNRLTFED